MSPLVSSRANHPGKPYATPILAKALRLTSVDAFEVGRSSLYNLASDLCSSSGSSIGTSRAPCAVDGTECSFPTSDTKEFVLFHTLSRPQRAASACVGCRPRQELVASGRYDGERVTTLPAMGM